MTDINQLILRLRKMTQAGIVECKKALEKSEHSLEKAVDFLRKSGAVKTVNKISRDTNAGLVCTCITKDAKTGAIVLLNSETDFVSRNVQFHELLGLISDQVALQPEIDTIDKLLEHKLIDASSISDAITAKIAILGENIKLSNILKINTKHENGMLFCYTHNRVPNYSSIGDIAVIIEFFTENEDISLDDFKDVFKQIAMHIVVLDPMSLDIKSIPSAVLDRELDCIKGRVNEMNKPDNVASKMVDGMLQKFYEQYVLLEQSFVFCDKTSVKDILSKNKFKISNFIRLSIK